MGSSTAEHPGNVLRFPTPKMKGRREFAVHILEVAMMLIGELTRKNTNFRLPWPKLLRKHAGPVDRAKTRRELLSPHESQPNHTTFSVHRASKSCLE